MLEIKHNWHTVEIQDSIEELNIVRFQDFNRYAVLDMGVGSDIQSIAGHLEGIAQKITAGQTDDGLQAIENMQATVHLILSGVNVESMSFACLVNAIDGKKITDHSESGLKNIVEELKEKKITISVIRNLIEQVKKK